MRATLVLLNGNIHTMDAAHPHAQAIAIAGERVVAVGSNQAMRARLADGGEIIDLVVLSTDIFQGDPTQLLETAVLATMMGGTFVYRTF